MTRKSHKSKPEKQVIRLTVADQEVFAQAILNPPELSPAMERATERLRRFLAGEDPSSPRQ
jgi:uncharacterized protein (DUF1778 family)